MIATLSGTVKHISANSAVIDVGGVGLLVQLSPRISAGLVVGSHAAFHTTLLVREDSLTLFGFTDSGSKELFELLQTVTGIGPKVAQSAMSIYDASEIVSAIRNDNNALLERIPGLGKKGAARLLLELKEKVGGFGALTSSALKYSPTWREQLVDALVALGFQQREADLTLEALAEEIASDPTSQSTPPDLSQLLRRALQLRGSAQ